MLRRPFKRLPPLLALVAAGSASQAADLPYVRCQFNAGAMAGLEANYYLDDHGKRLLNDNKAEFGKTLQWTEELVIIGMAQPDGDYITSINRLTGEFSTYTDGKQLKTLNLGKCNRASPPTKKF